jgi:hypothetical protein
MELVCGTIDYRRRKKLPQTPFARPFLAVRLLSIEGTPTQGSHTAAFVGAIEPTHWSVNLPKPGLSSLHSVHIAMHLLNLH